MVTPLLQLTNIAPQHHHHCNIRHCHGTDRPLNCSSASDTVFVSSPPCWCCCRTATPTYHPEQHHLSTSQVWGCAAHHHGRQAQHYQHRIVECHTRQHHDLHVLRLLSEGCGPVYCPSDWPVCQTHSPHIVWHGKGDSWRPARSLPEA